MATPKKAERPISELPRILQKLAYEREAQAYLASLPPEHFMEATAQATQRAITVASLALVQSQRPDFHVFNELLVQYPLSGRVKPGQVVPDNMVVLTEQPIEATTCYNVALELAGPFLVLEYVSKSNPRKDYEGSFRKYEKELKVPYYLLFYPDNQELTLYRQNRRRFVSVKPNRQDRYAIAEVELEVAILDGWVRYWHRGQLLPLPAELQHRLEEANRRADEQQRRADEQQRRADEQQRRADEQQRRADEEKTRADELLRLWQAAQEELAALRQRPEQV